MKYTYAYKTSDGTRHEASMNAESREAVFAELRKQGIKAIKVVAADGSKANGEVRGIRKRVLVASVIGAVFVSGIITMFLERRGGVEAVQPFDFDSSVRRQVIGDAAIIEKGIRTGWADVFELEGERFLASFAIPGVPAGQRTTNEEEFRKALDHKPVKAEGIEARQIVAMVEGMKVEARRFLASGGRVAKYGRRLVQRQEQELHYYNLVEKELQDAAKSGLDKKELEALWERRNDDLRQMGIKLVPMPE